MGTRASEPLSWEPPVETLHTKPRHMWMATHAIDQRALVAITSIYTKTSLFKNARQSATALTHAKHLNMAWIMEKHITKPGIATHKTLPKVLALLVATTIILTYT